ncbi:hypothetical protein B0A54_08533 [Friedmanniomyces endolithicus]|uniref:Uncharacterized protein n=1 Tax=Friedmanniomyces endolithicus TaxID=329885 RepID=A0A4U0UTA8_9PEZI|nr:hypothetical protein B0A54_08533 [Friedmanniomyces endolithicus]
MPPRSIPGPRLGGAEGGGGGAGIETRLCVDGGGGGGGGGKDMPIMPEDGFPDLLGAAEGGGGGGGGGAVPGVEGGLPVGAGGGGGGGAAGLDARKALRAACAARVVSRPVPLACGVGGGSDGALGMTGAVRAAIGGGRGAPEGGKGGADGGVWLLCPGVDGTVGNTDTEEGLREAGGGMGGFLPIGGGGFGFVPNGGLEFTLATEGRRLFLSADTPGGGGAAAEGGNGGAPPGGRSAKPFGGAGGALGALPGELRALVSGSESYMFTPPALFRSFGIPPAKMPPSCTGGAPPTGGPADAELVLASIMGADRSFTTVFLSRVPLDISPSKAPYRAPLVIVHNHLVTRHSIVLVLVLVRFRHDLLFPGLHSLAVSQGLLPAVEEAEEADLQRFSTDLSIEIVILADLQSQVAEVVEEEGVEAYWKAVRLRWGVLIRSDLIEFSIGDITRVTLQWNWDGSAFAASAYLPSEYHNRTPIGSHALQCPSPNREQDGVASLRNYTTNVYEQQQPPRKDPVSKRYGYWNLNALHSRILDLANTALKPEGGKLPAEQRVLYVLEQLQALAKNLIDGQDLETAGTQRPTTSQGSSATSALLGSVNTRPYPSFISQASLLNLISEKAEEILRHPTIFITPALLKSYVDLQTLLHQPSSLPDIFDLYARKPIPSLSSTGNITYGIPSPSKINSAIPTPTANLALQSAIAAHNLSLCLDIITTSFSAPAYRRALIIRRAALPFAGLAVLPLAAYTASQAFATQFQTSMSPSYATGIAFAGIMAYTVHVSTIGYVAITTSNDQMDRVTWAQGVPLWERWVREEERAAVDALAGKWGFRVRNQRGEEGGEEWEVLREFVGLRGMELDRAELMDGME